MTTSRIFSAHVVGALIGLFCSIAAPATADFTATILPGNLPGVVCTPGSWSSTLYGQPSWTDSWIGHVAPGSGLTLILAFGNSIKLIDGVTKQELYTWTSEVTGGTVWKVAAHDVDADGLDEVIATVTYGCNPSQSVLIEWSGGATEVGAQSNAPSVLPSLGASSPNPTSTGARIEFAVPSTGTTELAIYDSSGRLVRELAKSRMEAGAHSIDWDGRNEHGDAVASGVYFYRLTHAGRSDTDKAIVLR